MAAVTSTLWRLVLGVACVLAGLAIVREPGTARSLVWRGRGGNPPSPEQDPTVRQDRAEGDEDGRARAAGGFLFVLGVTLLLGEF